MRRGLLLAVSLVALLCGPGTARAGGIAEIRDGAGRLLASAGPGSFASAYDAGWTMRVDSASRSERGVELRGVSVAQGLVYAGRIFVHAHGLRGARVDGLQVRGRAVAARPNTLVPLGPASYLVVLQEAVVPGEGSGVVGLRVVSGDTSSGLDSGTQLLIGLARAVQPSAHHRQARLSWLSLGVSGHGASTGLPEAFPEFLTPPPSNGPIGRRAVAIAERYLGVPYLWGGAD